MSEPQNISVDYALREYKETVSIIESLKAQKSHTFHLIREAIERKTNFKDKYTEHISNVNKFHGEVAQFEADVKNAESSGKLSRHNVAKKIAYEEDQAIQDMKKAAEGVIKFGELKQRTVEKREKFQEQDKPLQAIMMTDNYLIAEAVLRDLSYYYWEAYSDIRVLASRLGKETGYTQFRDEINQIKNDRKIKEAEEVIRENYGGPGKLNEKRYAGLEENAQIIVEKLEQQS